MFRAINEYLAKLNIVTDDELLKEMNDYLEKQSQDSIMSAMELLGI